MDVREAVICTIVGILAVTAAGGFLGPERERVETAFGVFVVAFAISWVGWIIFIAQHFIAKYW